MNVRCNFARYLILSLLLGLLFPVNSVAQVDEDDSFEVYLAFRHRGVINSIVTSYYLDDVFYLPVNGLFSTLDFEANVNGLVVQGNFGLDQIPYRIDLENYTITFAQKVENNFLYNVTIYKLSSKNKMLENLCTFWGPTV